MPRENFNLQGDPDLGAPGNAGNAGGGAQTVSGSPQGAAPNPGPDASQDDPKGVAPERMVELIRENPLLLAQIVTENNPEGVSGNLMSLGLTASPATNPDLLDQLLSIAPKLAPSDLKVILDVPFDFSETGPDATTPGMYETYRIAAARQGLKEDEATWATAFPNATAAIGEAQADFHGQSYDPNAPASRKGPCPACRLRQMRMATNILVFIALVLFVLLLIKKL